MNTKKIWMLAILFGMGMSVFFLILTTTNGHTNQAVDASTLVDDEIEEIEKLKKSIEIEEGKRAISIDVNEVQSVSGFVRPGSYVDVVAILPVLVGDDTSAQILMENLKVLAVGKTFIDEDGENQEPYQTVTLEVSAAEGASLALSKEVGVVTLMLRGVEDQEASPHVNISLEQLIKGKMPK